MGIVAMAEVARAVVEQVQRDHPGVRIRAEGEAEAWADPSLVHQILVHLVLNAAQALDGNGDVLVRVAAGRVLVNDSGPGIPAENVEKIFAPFFTTRTRGMGLGLAIGAKAASAMGGQLRLGSGPLPGAAFVLELGSRPPAAD
jgi:signal transduction histidine kinase